MKYVTLMVAVCAMLMWSCSPRVTTTSQPDSIERGLVAHFPFDGNTKNIASGGVSCKEHGYIKYENDEVALFNGENNFLELESNLNLSFPWTFSCMIYKPKYEVSDNFYDNDRVIYSSDYCRSTKEAMYCGYVVRIYKDQPVIMLGGGYKSTRKVKSKKNLDSDKWSHLVVVLKDKDNVSIFIDGVEQDVYFDDRDFTDIELKNAKDRIGFDNDTEQNKHFEGKLDDVRIYRRALNSNEVAMLFNSTR